MVIVVMWKVLGIYNLSSFLEHIPIYVIDIGAAGGIDRRWERFGDNLKIFLFEPEREAYYKLVEFFNSDSRAEVFDCALSEDGKALDLHITKWVRSTSVYRPLPSYVETSNCLGSA